jgi:hypothetical protein
MLTGTPMNEKPGMFCKVPSNGLPLVSDIVISSAKVL